MNEIKRAIEMLKIASNYIRECPCDGDYTVFYDDAICDGWCVADDCESAAEMLEGFKNKHE